MGLNKIGLSNIGLISVAFSRIEFIDLQFIRHGTLALFLGLLFLTACKDYHTRRIPDTYVAGILSLCGLFIWLFPAVHTADRLVGGLSIGLLLTILSLAGEGAFGGGDIKLMAAAGIVLGTGRILAAFVLSVLAAGLYAGFFLLLGRIKWKESFAMGPFLCAGIWTAMIYGDYFMAWFLAVPG